MPVYDLEGVKANVKNFISYVTEKRPSFIFLNGHGNADVITGNENEVLVNSLSRLDDCVIYARSCDAAENLGVTLVENGAKAFIGYSRKFTIGYTPENIYDPLGDPVASLFLEPSNLVASTLVKGHTVLEANTRSKGAMYKNFRKMISGAATFEELHAAQWLWSNLKGQVLLGDPDAKM